jgi:phage regulator Rha-like protein
MIHSESRKVAAKFKQQHDTVTRTFDEAAASNSLAQNKFRILMKEAFENFKISIELEQTKRMR